MAQRIRSAVGTDLFYPADPQALAITIRRLLAGVPQAPMASPTAPLAVIAPHDAYRQAGPVIAAALAPLRHAAARLRRIVLLGPDHRRLGGGLTVPACDAFATPLGLVSLDRNALARLWSDPDITVCDRTHAHEHSLEVLIPFLQALLPDFSLVPILVDEAIAPARVQALLETLWSIPDTAVVVSSDLSHYLSAADARQTDTATAAAIEALDGARLQSDEACGHAAIAGLLATARARGLTARVADLRHSGDITGACTHVTGYGAFAFYRALDDSG